MKKLKLLRITGGMTQARLAKRAGLSQQYISLLERGGYLPSRKVVKKLQKALGTDLRGIFDA